MLLFGEKFLKSERKTLKKFAPTAQNRKCALKFYRNLAKFGKTMCPNGYGPSKVVKSGRQKDDCSESESSSSCACLLLYPVGHVLPSVQAFTDVVIHI